MKKYSTNYWEWTGWFTTYLFLFVVLLFAMYKGVTYDKKYTMDLTGYTLTLVTLAGVGLTGWEMTILFDFLISGVSGEIHISETDLTIVRKRSKETLKLKDIKSVEFVSQRFGTNSVTSYVSHCRLIFASKTIFLTSFTIKNDDIAQHLKIKIPSVRSRERKYFELMN